MGGYYIVHPKNYPHVGVSVVWPRRPKKQSSIAYVEGPFDTPEEVIVWMNKRDIPNMLRPVGYRGVYNWIPEEIDWI